MTLTVSVALCTRNGARFVEEQVRSILAQTRPVSELVISDDASSDGTPDMAARVAAELAPDLPVTVLRNDPPLGVAANFAQAIAECGGDLVALSDQDDVWTPDRLARLVPAFEQDPDLLLVHGDARLVDEQGDDLGSTLFQMLRVSRRERRLLARGAAFDAYLGRNLVTGATTVFRRSLADVALPVPDGWIHDEWLGALAAATGRVAVQTDPLIGYRQHSTNEIGVRELTLAGGVAKLRAPRSERNQRLLRRAESLVARLDALGDRVDPRVRELARGKRAHERARSALPSARAARLPGVVAAWARGHYRRYGLGVKDAVRDLIQPD